MLFNGKGYTFLRDSLDICRSILGASFKGKTLFHEGANCMAGLSLWHSHVLRAVFRYHRSFSKYNVMTVCRFLIYGLHY